MKLLFFPMHGQAAQEIAILCRGAGIALDIAGASNRLVSAKSTPADQIMLRRYGVAAPTDEEILDTTASGGYSAVMIAAAGQVVEFREQLQPLRRDLPLLARHSRFNFSDFQQVGVQNFFSPSPRALLMMRSCHTMLKPKLLDWEALPEIGHRPDQRQGSGSYVHRYARYWPRAWSKFSELNRLLAPQLVANYGMENEQGVVHDLDAMRRSRATVHLKDGGACCFAVLRSMAVGTPVVMDAETHEQCFFDGTPGILVRQTIPELADELRRLATDDEYWISASTAAYRTVREHTSFNEELGRTFREFVAQARRPIVGRRTGSLDLGNYHERLMQRLFRLHGRLESSVRAAARYCRKVASYPRARRTAAAPCVIGGIPARLPAEYAAPGLEEWELASIHRIQAWLATAHAPLVIDVGCSLGRISGIVLFAHPRARVVSIDSDLQSIAATRRSCALAPGARTRLITVHGFVSDQPTAGHDYIQEGRRTAIRLKQTGASGAPQQTRYVMLGSAADDGSIPHHSLDSLFWKRLAETDVLIKCDVEGAELHVLRGASRLLASLRPTLLLSVHPQHLPRYGQTEEQIASYLQERGYSIERLRADHEQHWFCTHMPGV